MSRFINPRHLLGATKNSLSGLVFAWKGEQAFRHEVLVLAVLALLPLVVTGGVVLALVQRIREIGKGEIDDAKNY